MDSFAAKQRIKSWRENPLKFAVDNFGVNLDPWQEQVLSSIGGVSNPRRRVVMKACTGPGKSAVLAWAGWHRLVCFADRGEHPKGAALSGEGRDNLRDNLWAELSKWQARSEFLKAAFTWSQERVFANDHKETWFLSARSYPKDADQEAIGRSLSGLHSKYPFVLLDETGAMPVTVGQKAEQIFTGGVCDGLVIQAGNPTSTDGLLYNSCVNANSTTVVITITADPDDPKRTSRVDIEHAREQIRRHGKDNPWVMATILGQFPKSGFNTLLGLDEVTQAMGRHMTDDKFDFSQKRLGVDCARFGDDRTIIFPRQGLVAFKPVEMRGARSNEIAARVALAKSRWQSELEFVDDTGGYGSGVVDSLIQAGHTPMSVNFSSRASDTRYFNKRSEMWFLMAEWIKRGGKLPHVPELVSELTVPQYSFQNGKFRLEEKDQIKERLGRSPDYADALALTFAMADMPKSMTAIHPSLAKPQHAATEWDPFK
jgi:phage terminase large subunit